MKFGFDIHGVINKEPAFFAALTEALIIKGHEVHVITGSRITESIRRELAVYGIRWTKLFSITDYHMEQGNKVEFDEKGDPWIDPDLWNKTKAKYCLREKIHFHIDDSEIYGQFFHTPYCLFNSKRKRFQWYYLDQAAGEFLFFNDDGVKNTILTLAENFKGYMEAPNPHLDYMGDLK